MPCYQRIHRWGRVRKRGGGIWEEEEVMKKEKKEVVEEEEEKVVEEEEKEEETFDDIVIYDRRPLHVVNPHLLAVSSHRDDRDRDGEGEGNGEVKGGGKGNGEGKGGVKGGGEGGGKGKGGEGDGDCRMKVSLVIVTYGNGVATSLLAVDRFYATNPGTTLTSLASIVCPLCTRQT